MEKKKLEEEIKKREIVGAVCKDRNCPFHGNLKIRGRVFTGIVTRKFPKRITIEFERFVYVKKYERYLKRKTRIHSRLPDCVANDVNVNDIVQVQECRPLSKIINSVFIKKIKSSEKK